MVDGSDFAKYLRKVLHSLEVNDVEVWVWMIDLAAMWEVNLWKLMTFGLVGLG